MLVRKLSTSSCRLLDDSDDSTEDRTPRPCSTALRHAAAKSDSGSPRAKSTNKGAASQWDRALPRQTKMLWKIIEAKSQNLHEPPTSALSPSSLIFSYLDLPSRVAPHGGPCSLVKSMESSTRRRTRGARSRPLCRQSTEYPAKTFYKVKR